MSKENPFKELRIGIVSGVSKEGKFTFHILGEQPSIPELIGLAHHTKCMVDDLYDKQTMRGKALIDQVGQAVGAVHDKLGQLLPESDDE